MSVQHTLKHPIVLTTRVAGEEAEREEVIKAAGDTVTVRRPKARDMKVMDRFADREIEGTIQMIAALTGLDVLHVENMDAEDFGELGEIVGNFVAPGRPTGGTASQS